MEENIVKPEKKLWQYLLRGAIAFFATFLVKSLTTPRFASFDTSVIPSQVFFAFALLGVILIFNSMIHTLTLYDADCFEKFKKRKVEKVTFFKELGNILHSPEFWLETAPALALALLFSFFGGFYEVVYAIFPLGKAPAWSYRLLPVVVITPLFFLVSLICRYEIHRYWVELIKKNDNERVKSKAKFALKLAVIFLMYPLVFPYTPYVAFVIITFFGLVGALVSVLSILGFIAAAVGLVFLIIWLMKRKNRKLRKKFFKDMRLYAERAGFELVEFDKEQAEVRSYDFYLKKDSKVYSCRVIKALSGATPLYFTSSSDAYFLHRLGTKSHHTSIEKHFEYSFVADGQKLLLLIKFPKRTYVSSDGATKKLFPGDKIWNYILFDTRSFLGALDRDCLGRSNDENR